MATIYVTENGNYFDKHDIERAMEIVFGIDRDNVEYYFYDKIDLSYRKLITIEGGVNE